MFANSFARTLARAEIHYGWVMVAIAFLTTVCSSAALTLPGVLLLPITEEFGWSRTDVSIATAVMFTMIACMGPFSGALMLRYGMAKVVATSTLLLTLGLLTTIMVSEKWHIILGIGVLLGTAAGMIGLGLAATIASRWFVARRGLVVGILTAAFAAGQLTFMPVAAWLTTNYDWRVAVLPAMIGCAFCAFLFLLLGRDWPSDVDLPAYGETKVAPPSQGSAAGAMQLAFSALGTAVKTPIFWVLASTFFICGLSSTGIVQQHFIAFCGDNNVGAVAAASYLAIMGIFNFVGTIGSGWLSDRVDNRLLLAIYYGLRGVSLIYLPFSDFSVFALTLWAIFFGLDFIATVPPTVRMTTQRFGPALAPVVFGWIFAAHQLGSAAAAYGAGVTRDSVLSYLPAFIFAGLACFVAVALIATVRASRPAVPQPA